MSVRRHQLKNLRIMLVVTLVFAGCSSQNRTRPPQDPSQSPDHSPSVSGSSSVSGPLVNPPQQTKGVTSNPQKLTTTSDAPASQVSRDEKGSPIPDVDANGNRTRAVWKFEDPCKGKPCGMKQEDIETEEDRRYSLPPKR